jgi:hypothetical protein
LGPVESQNTALHNLTAIRVHTNGTDDRSTSVVVLGTSIDAEPAQPLVVSAHTLVVSDVGHDVCVDVLLQMDGIFQLRDGGESR